jgi:O-acetyl-ADP-ribose deacetylase (regulator of RNase III)
MTVKELRMRIKELGGSGYSRMRKAELEEYLAKLEALNASLEDVDTTSEEENTKEERVDNMKTRSEFTGFTPMEDDRSKNYVSYFNSKNADLAPTKGQIRFFNTMRFYYEFDSKYEKPAATRREMSLMLDEMNNLIKQGKVTKKSNSSRQVKPATNRRADRVTDRQLKAISELSVQLGRTITVPRDKVTAFNLIKQLREELAAKQNEQQPVETAQEPIQEHKQEPVQENKQSVTKQVAVTKSEPERKPSLIRRILNKLFKRNEVSSTETEKVDNTQNKVDNIQNVDKLTVVDGNILSYKKGVIVHQVNNRHVMGAGLALQIRQYYPRHYSDYMKSQLNLGDLVVTDIDSDLTIVGCVAQDGYGRDRRYTDYDSLRQCLSKIASQYSDKQVYIPYGIGCGLAGGDWNTVENIIKECIPNATLIRYRKER